MSRAVGYYSYRDGPDVGERQWQTAAGEILTPEQARVYAKEQAATHGFTYQIVLSNEEGLDIGAEGYKRFLDQEEFIDYVFLEHHNTENAHSHIIAWRSQVISKKEISGFLSRYDQVAAEIKREQEQHREIEREQGREVEQEQAVDSGQGPTPVVDLFEIVQTSAITTAEMQHAAGELRETTTSRDQGQDLLALLETLQGEPQYGFYRSAVMRDIDSKHSMELTAGDLRQPERQQDEMQFWAYLEQLDKEYEQQQEQREAQRQEQAHPEATRQQDEMQFWAYLEQLDRTPEPGEQRQTQREAQRQEQQQQIQPEAEPKREQSQSLGYDLDLGY